MKWLLLNQLSVSMSLTNCVESVLEELVSSELQLAQVLVSDTDLHRIGILQAHFLTSYNQRKNYVEQCS